MMTNADIAEQLKLFSDISELHGGNPFKIKSYSIAAFRIDKMPEPLAGKSLEELVAMEGVGKSVASKVLELTTTGTLAELEKLKNETPPGVLDLFKVKGIGPKKIAYLWHELGIESIGELLYACKENRLVQAKGFGIKTQETIQKNIEFLFANADKFHYTNLERTTKQMVDVLKKNPLIKDISPVGALRRKCDIQESMDLLVATTDAPTLTQQLRRLGFIQEAGGDDTTVTGRINGMIPLRIHTCTPESFHTELYFLTGTPEHLAAVGFERGTQLASEKEIYASRGLDYIEPEMREGLGEVEKARNHALPRLIEVTDLKGSLHNHSTWSDGTHTLEEMATYCKQLGYEYLGICDHSKTAFYANGLKEDRVIQQHAEIDALNKKLAPFRIFKGIESDILNDGRLDYENDVLASFDFIVASVHSNLKMTEEKAMSRLIPAIENPYTTILGHPTGRLLLMREGYPVDHQKMIDACAANGVVIELNANPYRLDLDWKWIDYALNKGVMISINPDAHEKEGFHDMYYGTCSARKGGLTREMCFNALDAASISAYFEKRRSKH